MIVQADPKSDLWAFREGRNTVAGNALVADLFASTSALSSHPGNRSLAIAALMRAGELETGLADANSPAQAHAQKLTDALAGAFVHGSSAGTLSGLLSDARLYLENISAFHLPEQLNISPPEGFAYYALHPHDFARLVDQIAGRADFTLVIGIRSIGTTLSAIVRAALDQQSNKTERMTVRPTGHPYDRVVQFSPPQLQTIQEWTARASDFVVVDEGPGRSGSSFLSVAEALVRAGVAPNRIKLLGSRPVDVNQLCAANSRQRWSHFTFLWPEPSVYTRFSDHLYLGGGKWRELLFDGRLRSVPCWPQMERLKFLSPDRHSLFKFEGFGRFGQDVLARAHILEHAGFGVHAEDADDGMVRYPVLEGSPAHSSELSPELLKRIAAYCALRAAEFRCPAAPPTQLPAMLGFNIFQEFGVEVGSEVDQLCTHETVLADGRMQPHEWIHARSGLLRKVDAYTHGDDHFFPGPTDIAWDLAGTVVEWNLDRGASQLLLSEFRRISGKDRAHLLPVFVLAYTVFRLAYFKMALSTVQGSSEEPGILAAYRHYRALAEQHLREMPAFRAALCKPSAPASSLSSALQPGTAA